MTIDQLLLALVVAACPATAVVSIVGTLLALRAAGFIGAPQQRQRRRKLEVVRLPRIPEDDMAAVLTGMVAGGWKFLFMREVATGVFSLWFQEREG